MTMIVEYSLNRGVAITPDDDNDLSFPSGENRTKGLYVGVSGDVSVTFADGSTVVLKSLVAGVVHHLSVKRIKDTGTTATDIVALF
jgi:hypothetical protein